MSDEQKPPGGINVSITGSTVSGQLAVGSGNYQSGGQPVGAPQPEAKPGGTALALNGAQRRQLLGALLGAFPSMDALAQMVSFGMDENLATISSGGNIGTAGFELMEWAGAHGRLEDLIRAARNANPGNPELRAFAAGVGLG